MSKETLAALNTNTLIGHTDRRGNAWHYRAEHQGAETNHYQGPIPVEDVRRRLFSWRAESRPVAVEKPCTVGEMSHLDSSGAPAQWAALEGRQAITRSDTHGVMGIFSDGYERHQYDEWLLRSVGAILDADLSISSAGLLRGGAVAWVEVGVADTISTPEGVDFRPNLLATTSFDGSIATTFKRTITATVCDNTRDLALGEPGGRVKVKHSKNSRLRLSEARDALEIVHSTADQFASEVRLLCSRSVPASAWTDFLDHVAPAVDGSGKPLEGRALTIAERKRDALHRLYSTDPRVAPWSGTAFGVLQAVNTFEHHEGVVRGSSRAERNMLRTVSGDFSRLDRSSYRLLERVLQSS